MSTSAYHAGILLDPSKPDENASWQMTLETLTSELCEVGIEQSYIRQTAAFIFSSIHNYLPLLLVGPSGNAIADALSVSLFGATSGTLDASLPYDSKCLADVETGNDQIIAVTNVFSGNWLIPLIGHLQNTKKHFILLHPFPEDLQIEPHSLFRYAHPVLTEPILHEIKKPDFLGGKNLPHYKFFESNHVKLPGTILSGLPITRLHADRLLKVIADAQQMLEDDCPELSLLLAVFPYAYAIGKPELIAEKLASASGISKNTIERIEGFLKL